MTDGANQPGGLDARGQGMCGVHVSLLGGFTLRCGGTTVSLPMAPQRVLAYLALHRQALHRAFVAENLWFGGAESDSQACLRSALWRIRRLCATPVVCRTRTHVQLHDHVTVDVHGQIDAAQKVFDRSVAVEDISWSVLRSDLLPDWYDSWVLLERERLRQLRLHALEALAIRLAEEGRFGEAVDIAHAALSGEPLRESAHRTLIRIHLEEGNRTEALRGLERYRRLLRSRVGIEPSRDIQDLVGPTQSGDGSMTRR
jgi:DNA-binding SARP family transcriptional activator